MKFPYSIFTTQTFAFINHGGVTTVAKDPILVFFKNFLLSMSLTSFTLMVINMDVAEY